MTKRPNILWLMTDEQRADSMGYEGTPWARTPNLDRVARAGTRFSAAYTPSPVCVPARACMLTGRAGSSIGVLSNHHWLNLDDPRFLTWQLAAAGYQVASFGKQHYNCFWRAFDTEAPLAPDERVHYYHYQVAVDAREAGVVRYDGGRWPWLFAGRYPGTVDDTPEAQAVRGALDWLRAAPGKGGDRDRSRPFFLRVSFRAPHTPVVTPAPFDTMIDPEAIDLPLDYVKLLIASVAGISLGVGGLGILAVMLISVRERRREIGLRRAVGARRRDIRSQFLLESGLLAGAGGVVGVVVGAAAAVGVSALGYWPTTVSWPTAGLAFAFSVVVGIVFGIYPAVQAARMQPVEALRSE